MRNRTENQMKRQIDFFLVRHGLTLANEEHRYLGKTDEALSERGIREIRQKARHAGKNMPELVFTSPMQRCVQSARILFPDVNIVEISQWGEIDFGIFEYKTHAQLDGNPRYQAWIDSGGTIPFPDGESREEFVLRCVQGMEQAVKILCQREFKGITKVAAVVHGGTIMALLSSYCGGDYFDYQVENADGYHVGLFFDSVKQGKEIEIKL